MAFGYDKVSTLDPRQKALAKRYGQGMMQGPESLYQSPLYQAGGSYLQNLLQGGPEAFARFEAPYLRQFEEQTIPGLAERFGGMGAQSSSAFQQALGQAGAGLSENLASLRSGLQMQALPQALGFAQQPFTNLQNYLGESHFSLMESPLMKMLSALMEGAGKGATMAFL